MNFISTRIQKAAFLTLAAFMVISAQAQLKQLEIRGDWFNQDRVSDLVAGVSVDKTYANLAIGRTPHEIVVAVIDSGVDIEHEDLAGSIWVNEDEIPDNGIDDDGNGYIDDVNGWSFISGPGGDVHYDNLEFTRIYKSLKERFSGKNSNDISKLERPDYERYIQMEEQFVTRVKKAREELDEFKQIVEFYVFAKQQMDQVFEGESYTVEDVAALESDDEGAIAIRDFMVFAMTNDFEVGLSEARSHYENSLSYSYNLELDTRSKVGDQPDDLSERYYGTPRVEGPAAEHGTHVAGIIAAQRGNGIGIDGIASHAKIMVLRVVPDGDERDKDVANAIRYAADNGAKIINMSFGKSYSPHKSVVDDAVAYAQSKGVLMVHAAGNSSRNNDKSNNFPNPTFQDTQEFCETWIEVGASGKTTDELVASFTNFGMKSVDIFAPGVDIESTIPDNEYKANSGTSMAAPVVSGVAALIWSYFPELSAQDVREIIVASYHSYGKVKVERPDKPRKSIRFKKLSRTGGVVDAYNAFNLAASFTAK